MALRTYLPGILQLMRKLCKYGKRWETQIRTQLPDGAAQTAFTNVLVACEAFEDIVSALIPPPT